MVTQSPSTNNSPPNCRRSDLKRSIPFGRAWISIFICSCMYSRACCGSDLLCVGCNITSHCYRRQQETQGRDTSYVFIYQVHRVFDGLPPAKRFIQMREVRCWIDNDISSKPIEKGRAVLSSECRSAEVESETVTEKLSP